MAKVIATIGGVALRPGVSANRRLYTAPMIAKAVQVAQERIRAGDKPLVMLTHHGAADDSRQIAASLTDLSLDEDGNARFKAGVTDTAAGRDIASLVDSSSGEPHLKGTSIRGFWTGTVRKLKGADGKPVETADGLELDGLDFTRSPGVGGAEVDTFAWADRSGRSETTERVAIYESVQEARVTTIAEETTAPDQAPAARREADPAVMEAMSADLPAPHIFEDGLCLTCGAGGELGEGGDAPGDGSKPYGNVPYADPGYQPDKKKRYPLNSKAHARSALAYIQKKANAAKYTASQLKRVMGRIKAACKKFGISVATESGWVFDDPQALAEQVAECMVGCDPAESGSYCLTASNGPTNISISDYRLDPAELDPVLRKAVDAACAALKALDPDMDGDIDVPGAPKADTDHDGGESTVGDPAGEAGHTDPADPAATQEGKEDPAMAETTPAEQAPDVQAQIAEGITAGLARAEEARRARKAEKRAARETAAAAAAQATESAAAAQRAANVAAATGTPATQGAAVSETDDERKARLAALVDARVAEAAKAAGLVTEKTDEDLVAEMVEERLVPLRQAQAEKGGVQRKGVTAQRAHGMDLLESIGEGAPGSAELLQKASNDDLARLASAAYPHR